VEVDPIFGGGRGSLYEAGADGTQGPAAQGRRCTAVAVGKGHREEVEAAGHGGGLRREA